MSDAQAHFQTATRKGGRPLWIDDRQFTLKRATLASADLVAKVRGQLNDPNNFDASRITGMLRPFVHDEDWDEFTALVMDMEAADLTKLVTYIAGQAMEGLDPTAPVSSPPASSVTGGGSPAGVSTEGSTVPTNSN
jgi:hypothetical protein